MAKNQKSSKAAAAEETTAENPAGASCQDLYAALGVEKTASPDKIKKAYHRMALKLHPDKNPGDESAKEKFQTLQHVFSVLGNPEKRKIYDETGSTDDVELAGEKFNDLYDYYRTVFRKIEVEDIEKFTEEYRGSEEEAKDLKELYTRFKGDMEMLFQWMMCSQPETDSHRFKDAIEAAIKSGELKSYKAFKSWASEVSKKPAPAIPLKPKKSSKGTKDGVADLALLIRSRQEARSDALFDRLAAKYGDKPEAKHRTGKSKRQAAPDFAEPSEEEFLAAQSRVLKKKGRK